MIAWVGGIIAAATKKFLEENENANKVQPLDDKPVILITGEQLKDICTRQSLARCNQMADLLNKLCVQYGMDNINRFEEFLANVIQESGEFEHKTENMNYRAETIVKTWPSRFKTIAAAQPFARNPKSLAINVYGGRMGNRPGTDDGWNFRGGGFIGLTGRYTYEAFQKFKGHKTVEQTAEYVRSSDYGALDSALWFFCILKKLMTKAEQNDFIGIVKEINGGTIGLKDREFYLKRVKKVLG